MVEVYKYGQMEVNIQDIGKMIKQIRKVSSFIVMEIYTKVNG
jgi:hypothetical protein